MPPRTTALALLLLLAVGTGAACRGRREKPAPPPATPGGPAAAWELVFEREIQKDTNNDLFVVAATGGVERRLTDGPAIEGLPRWTADGRSVVFSSDQTGNFQLWEVDAEGGRPRRLRTSTAREFQADPSPDGRSIAFLTNLDGPERLVLLDRVTGALRELVRHGSDPIFGNPHWSPDGRFITYSSNWRLGHQIYVVEVATGAERRISGVTTGGCEPRFSRDGRKVVYVSRGHMRPTSRLIEDDLASGEERALVSWPALNYDPVYSPDGTELAFASDITGEYAIYRQRLSDGQAWRVTFGTGAARSPDYRPLR